MTPCPPQKEPKSFIKVMLSEEQIKMFQAIYKEQFGREISPDEAYQSGAKLVRLMELIYKPMTKAEFEIVQRRRAEIFKKLPGNNNT
jgi:hypothetical protein